MYNKSFIISILLLVLAIAAAVSIASRKPPVVVRTNLENLPMQIGEYVAAEDTFSQSVYDELNADKHVYRHYRSPEGEVIDLYIGYYGTAKGGRTGHNPYACLPGAGWGVIKDETVHLNPSYTGGEEAVRLVTTQKGGTYQIMLHWYQSDGTKVLGSGLEQNIQRFLGMVLHNKNDGAFVRVSMNVSKEHIEKARQKVQAFSEKILELLPKYWPKEARKLAKVELITFY